MHIGFRYHIASLVAVFFSLVLGMLIGSALFQDDRLVQEQGYIIGDLENRFKALELRTQTLQNNLELAREKEQIIVDGWDQIRSLFIDNRLSGSDVVLFSYGSAITWDRIVGLMEAAGAEVHDNQKFPAELEQLTELTNNLAVTADHQPIAVIWVDKLLDESLMKGISYLQENEWKISIVQPFSSTISLHNFSSNTLVIDFVDTPLGELALVQGLSQSLTGNYGWKRQATSLLPVLDLE